jgi:hypothetical protein
MQGANCLIQSWINAGHVAETKTAAAAIGEGVSKIKSSCARENETKKSRRVLSS